MILYRFQCKIKFKGRSKKNIVYIEWNIEFIFFAHSEKQCLQQSKNSSEILFTISSSSISRRKQPKNYVQCHQYRIHNSSQKNIQGKNPSIIIKIVLSLCALYSKSNPKLYSKKHFELSSWTITVAFFSSIALYSLKMVKCWNVLLQKKKSE